MIKVKVTAVILITSAFSCLKGSCHIFDIYDFIPVFSSDYSSLINV